MWQHGSAITKRWWELSCVRRFFCLVVAVLLLQVPGECHDAPVGFASGTWVSPEGLPGWESTPARAPETTVGVSGYWRSGEDVFDGEWALSAAGEWGYPLYRASFLYSYYALDSLYRESAVSFELSASRWFLLAGGGFGAVAQWVPGDGAWIRYRLKAGLSALLSGFTVSAWWTGFTDESPDFPWAGIFWEPSGLFSAFVQTRWESFTVGTLLHFSWGSVETSYGFPGFSLSLGISVGYAGYGAGVCHGTSGGLPAWNGVWTSKTFKK